MRKRQAVSLAQRASSDPQAVLAQAAVSVAHRHPLLRRDKPGDRLNWKTTALPAGGKWLTSLLTLRDMLEAYLGPYDRPATDQSAVEAALTMLLDGLASLSTFQDLAAGGSPTEWRAFAPWGRGHLLLRPTGQITLAQTLGRMARDPRGPRQSLPALWAALRRLDDAGGLLAIDQPASPFYGVLYDPTRQRVLPAQKDAASVVLERLLDQFGKSSSHQVT